MNVVTATSKRLDDLSVRANQAFVRVQERVFADDPDINSRLMVQAVEAEEVEGVPTLVLITPWVMNGLFFPFRDEGPRWLVIAGATRRVHRGDVSPLGIYRCVNLVPDVSRMAGPAQARALAHSYGQPFREAVRDWMVARS
jgi:hypothetical protein